MVSCRVCQRSLCQHQRHTAPASQPSYFPHRHQSASAANHMANLGAPNTRPAEDNCIFNNTWRLDYEQKHWEGSAIIAWLGGSR